MFHLRLLKALVLMSMLPALNAAAAVPSDQEIDAMIQKNRTSDLVIRTRPGAAVEITQTRHAFLFGTALSEIMWAQPEDFQPGCHACPDLNYLNDPDYYKMIEANREKYFQAVKENFNYAVHRNAAKWFITEYDAPGSIYYTPADRTLLWCKANNIPMRGHCIFWEIKEYNLPWLGKISDNEMFWHMRQRARSIIDRYRGDIDEWDLCNEMLQNRSYRDRLGEDVTDKMFAWSKEVNPDVTLYLNEYDVIDGKITDKYVDMIKDFQRRGLPIGGIGCQAHFYNEKVDFNKISDSLDKLSQFNLPIKITELSMSVKDEQLKAELLDRFLRLAFSKPAVSAIIFWGFWEEIQWLPQAALWKKDWTPTPAAAAYRNLVFDQWSTKTKGTADDKGIFKVRGFLGDYTINVTGDGLAKEIQVQLPKEGKTVTIQ